jgi:arsenate reductase
MAEGLWRNLGKGTWESFSAGSKPAGYVHPMAIEVMQEVGVDLSENRSKHVDEYKGQSFDLVVTVCHNAKDACPVFPGAKQVLHWPFDDPAHATGSSDEVRNDFRRVRKEIADRIHVYLSEDHAST